MKISSTWKASKTLLRPAWKHANASCNGWAFPAALAWVPHAPWPRQADQSKRAVHAGSLAVFHATAQNVNALAVEDVWGVGRRYAERLAGEGVRTAADLAALPTDHVRAHYGVVLARTQMELRGIPCSDLELEEPERQQLVVSRTFGRDVTDPMEALATFCSVACEKLRKRGQAAGALWVWLDGNSFKGDSFHASRAAPFPFPTQDTGEVLRTVRRLAKSIMDQADRGQGIQAYKRGGVGLTNLVQAEARQADLFVGPNEKAERTMAVLDQINAKFGRGTVGVGNVGWRVGGARLGEQSNVTINAQWRPILHSLSPSYTTKWGDLLQVR